MNRCMLRAALTAMALCFSATSPAQNYPSGPVRIVVPFPAGGGVDSMGRLFGQNLSAALGKPVVIDNRPGANGMIGSEIVAKSPKDGYTLLVNGANFVTTPSLYKNVTYDPVRDFAPVSLLAHAPNILVVHPSLPVKTVRDLIALAKARPDQLNYASSASGSTPHLAAELFKTLTGTRLVHVPYRGTGPAITAIIAGEITVMFMPALAAIPYVNNGRLRALGVTTAERLPALPELPTVAEAGLKGYQSSQWYGMLAPAGTPTDIVALLSGHAAKIMQSPQMKERMKNSGSAAVGSTRDVFAKHLQSEFAKWAKVIKESGARVD
ncbi:MAG: Bug family tripartite tricarboxylate transporter substrate binding protein [Burkholderiales bacterium]